MRTPKFSLSLALALVCVHSFPTRLSVAGIFGEDDRAFVGANSSPKVRELARSVAVMIPRNRILDFDDHLRSSYTALSPSYAQEWNSCPGIRFNEETSLPTCTAFLVGKRTLLTAAHCGLVNDAGCAGAAWAFDYTRDNEATYPHHPSTAYEGVSEVTLPSNLLYRCNKILASKYDPDGSRVDFALVELDRDVVGRTPLRLKTDGKFRGDESLFSIGASGGTALVTVPAAPVHAIGEYSVSGPYDLLAKGSGGPYFDAATGEVVGIGVKSSSDFYYRDRLYPPPAGTTPEACMREFILGAPYTDTITTPYGQVKPYPYTEAERIDYIEKRVPFLGLIR